MPENMSLTARCVCCVVKQMGDAGDGAGRVGENLISMLGEGATGRLCSTGSEME